MAKPPPPSINVQALADKAVLGLCETLALLFGLPFGEDLYNDKPVTWWHLGYLAIGLLFAVAGPMWPWIRTRTWLPESVSASLSRAALDARIWIAALLLLFIYGMGPEIYRRATQPIAEEPVKRQVTVPAPPVAVPSPLSSQDVITKIDIWQSLEARDMNPLVGAVNYGYKLQEQWPDYLRDRTDFLRQLRDLRQLVVDGSKKLDDLRAAYPAYRDVSEALVQPHTPELLKAIDNFSQVIAGLPDTLPTNYEMKIRPASGYLRQQLDATVQWISATRKTAAEKRKELSTLEHQ